MPSKTAWHFYVMGKEPCRFQYFPAGDKDPYNLHRAQNSYSL